MVHAPYQRRGYAVEGRQPRCATGPSGAAMITSSRSSGPRTRLPQAVARKLGLTPTRHIEFFGLDHRIWRRAR